MSDQLTVEPGQVRINYVQRVIDEEDVKVWMVDTLTKYPSWLQAWSAEDGHEVMFIATERTLRPAEGVDEATVIKINLPDPGDWRLVIDGAKYGFHIVAYRWREDATVTVWDHNPERKEIQVTND